MHPCEMRSLPRPNISNALRYNNQLLITSLVFRSFNVTNVFRFTISSTACKKLQIKPRFFKDKLIVSSTTYKNLQYRGQQTPCFAFCYLASICHSLFYKAVEQLFLAEKKRRLARQTISRPKRRMYLKGYSSKLVYK